MKILRSNNNVITDIKKEIRRVYIETKAVPWIIGYSGGKDSTTVLQLVIEVLIELKAENLANKVVHVISADTLVENPLVIGKTIKSLDNLKNFSKENNIPLNVELVYPKFNDTFHVNTIGKGYPSPLQSFRWCTDRIKIKPANDFILNRIDEDGEVILLLGTRLEESSSRKRSMEKHNIEGSSLSMHSSIENAFTYAPIANLAVNDIWKFLLENENPWGDDNRELYQLYSSSNADGECPLVIDNNTKNQGSCGNSRFGCWTCTVVTEDKSLTGFIQNGEQWLSPFLDFRAYLLEIRDDVTKRNIFDRNGNLKLVDVVEKSGYIKIPRKLNREEEVISASEVISEDKLLDMIKNQQYDPRQKTTIISKNEKLYRVGTSGFTKHVRADLLIKLLETEQEIRKELPEYQIIKPEEVLAIDKIWKDFGYMDINAIEIYEKYNPNIIKQSKTNIDFLLLNSIADEVGFNSEQINRIVYTTKLNSELRDRNKNIRFIEKVLSEHKTYLKGKNDIK